MRVMGYELPGIERRRRRREQSDRAENESGRKPHVVGTHRIVCRDYSRALRRPALHLTIRDRVVSNRERPHINLIVGAFVGEETIRFAPLPQGSEISILAAVPGR